MLFMSTLMFFKKSFRKYAIISICFCLIAFLYALHLGIDPTLKKFEHSDQGLQQRLITTQSMFPMLADYPVTGVGWGNFRYLYPRYVPTEWDGVSSSGYSHNDWIEAGTETGYPGLTIICAAFLIYIYHMTRLWLKRRNLHAVGIGAGVLTGLLAISFHSFFDFNMQIPANPLTLAAILGIGYSAIHRQGHGYSQSFFYRKRTIKLSRPMRMIVAAVVILVLGGLFHFTWRHAAAESAGPTEWNSTMNLNWNPERADLTEYLNKWLPLADQCFDAAIQCTPKDAYLLFNIGRYWVWRSQLLPKKVLPVLRDDQQLFQDDGIEKFQDLLQRYLVLNPDAWKDAFESVWESYPQDRVVFNIVPKENKELKSRVLQELAIRTQ